MRRELSEINHLLSSVRKEEHFVHLFRNINFQGMCGSGSKWLADKALAQLRNVPRIGLVNIQSVGRKPVR